MPNAVLRHHCLSTQWCCGHHQVLFCPLLKRSQSKTMQFVVSCCKCVFEIKLFCAFLQKKMVLHCVGTSTSETELVVCGKMTSRCKHPYMVQGSLFPNIILKNASIFHQNLPNISRYHDDHRSFRVIDYAF